MLSVIEGLLKTNASAKKIKFSLSDGRLLRGVFSGDLVKADADGTCILLEVDNMIETRGHRVSQRRWSQCRVYRRCKFGICFGLPNEIYGEEIRLICV